MSDFVQFPVIGVMHSPFREKFGIPRQPNLVQVESFIEIKAPYHSQSAFEGIEQFSHLWLLWQFHENKAQTHFKPQVRPPRLGGNEKVGVFATRSMYRPAPIGLSVVQFQRIEYHKNGLRIYVTGSDLLHGTPIVDIKPYITYSDAIPHAQSGYAVDAPVKKQVVWEDEVQKALLSDQLIQDLEEVLALDPRPAYQHDPERIYGMRFAHLNVRFKIGQVVCILDVLHVEN